MAATRLLHVGIGGPLLVNNEAIETAFNNAGIDWFMLGQHCWVVHTDRDIDGLRNIIHSVVGLKDAFVLFTAFNPMIDCDGWLPEWAWEWINSRGPRKA